MEEKLRKNLEDTANDCLDKAYACTADSDDYPVYIDKSVSIVKELNQERKIEYDYEVELKKIETEKEIELMKIEQSGKITAKDAFLAVIGISDLFCRFGFFREQMRAITNFEKTNTYVSSASRQILGTIKDIVPFNKRGR